MGGRRALALSEAFVVREADGSLPTPEELARVGLGQVQVVEDPAALRSDPSGQFATSPFFAARRRPGPIPRLRTHRDLARRGPHDAFEQISPCRTVNGKAMPACFCNAVAVRAHSRPGRQGSIDPSVRSADQNCPEVIDVGPGRA